MRVIIAGSRTYNDIQLVENAILCSGFTITQVISGGAKGIDQLGELYANNNNIPFVRYPANWELYGKSAGYKHNIQMAENADALIAIWDGNSKGTNHMINIATEKRLKTYVNLPTEQDQSICWEG